MSVIQEQLHDAETRFRDAARHVGRQLEHGVGDRDVDGIISKEAFELIRRAGLSAALVPTEYGGGGASHRTMGDVLREIGRHDPSTAVTLAMHSHLVATQLWRHKHGMDASGVFAKVGSGAILISTGATDWVSSDGSATRVDGGWRVSASKFPASGCEVGDIVVTSIRTEDQADVIHCAIPMSAEGVSVELSWDTLGMRATGSHTVVIDDVFVPDAAVSLVRPAGRWHPVWNAVLGSAMPLIMAAYLGVADAAVDIAIHTLAGRDDVHLPQAMGELITAHTRAEDTVRAMFDAADDLHFDNTDDLASRILARKSTAAEALVETVRLAIEAVGGRGYTRSTPLERLYRDIHGCLFHPLPKAKQLQFTGRVALGLDPIPTVRQG